MPRLAYLGPPGTYSEEAALRYRPAAQLVPCPNEPAVAAAVESAAADEGILAIENSIEGPVTRTVDLLVHDTELVICAEIILSIDHCLIARAGTKPAGVTVVRAHPQALSQCRRFLERELPRARPEAALSNAAAVQDVLAIDGAAAIASARAAELYGGEVIARDIQDNAHNKTRFVVLAARDGAPTGRDKTSTAFSIQHDKPGTLVEVLHEFSDRAINLTKIESRPSREELGIYIFLVDLEGHRSDPAVAEALAAVQAKSLFFRVLGSYPRSGDA